MINVPRLTYITLNDSDTVIMNTKQNTTLLLNTKLLILDNF